MYNDSAQVFRTIILKPHWFQFVINELPMLCIAVASFWAYAYGRFQFHEFFILVTFLLLMYLLLRLINLKRLKYVITAEQLIIMHGILSHSTDYVELYRVIDYRQHSSFPQQLFGLKTVSIFSGDKNNSTVHIIGIRRNVNVVSEIRMRVEYNRRRKGIYEFANSL